MVIYKRIPKTELEIANSGSSHSRIIFIRVVGKLEPMEAVVATRVLLVGIPQSRLTRAFASGAISRAILGELVGTVSSNTYSRIRQFVASSDGVAGQVL